MDQIGMDGHGVMEFYFIAVFNELLKKTFEAILKR